MHFIKSMKRGGGAKCASYKKNKSPKCIDQSGCKWVVKRGCKSVIKQKKKVEPPKKKAATIPKKSQKQKGFPKIKLDKYSLGKHGYKNTETLTENQRHNAINSAIGEYGAKPVLGKIGLLKTLHKYKKPELSRKYYDNMVWLREKYDGPPHFKQPYEKSALFRK